MRSVPLAYKVGSVSTEVSSVVYPCEVDHVLHQLTFTTSVVSQSHCLGGWNIM